MNAQEIVTELKRMSVQGRRSVADELAALAQPAGEESQRDIRDVLRELAGTAEGLPEDMSVNHDHYLYGTPKQQP